MLYRTAGQFKTSYAADFALFPVRQDAILLAIILAFAFIILPLTANEFVFQALLIPVLIYSLAALGLNILTGYAGQLSLGTGAFMGVGAYACYKILTIFPEINIVVAIALSGFFSAAVGVAFGVPTVALFGPTDPRLTPTFAPHESCISLGLECQPCMQRACPLKHHRCMVDLAVDRVFAAAIAAQDARWNSSAA